MEPQKAKSQTKKNNKKPNTSHEKCEKTFITVINILCTLNPGVVYQYPKGYMYYPAGDYFLMRRIPTTTVLPLVAGHWLRSHPFLRTPRLTPCEFSALW